jgi:hypothetical protein
VRGGIRETRLSHDVRFVRIETARDYSVDHIKMITIKRKEQMLTKRMPAVSVSSAGLNSHLCIILMMEYQDNDYRNAANR